MQCKKTTDHCLSIPELTVVVCLLYFSHWLAWKHSPVLRIFVLMLKFEFFHSVILLCLKPLWKGTPVLIYFTALEEAHGSLSWDREAAKPWIHNILARCSLEEAVYFLMKTQSSLNRFWRLDSNLYSCQTWNLKMMWLSHNLLKCSPN